jgi:hypothetical protein
VTAGNIVVVGGICETSTFSLPSGWTSLANVTIPVGSGSGQNLVIYAKCMAGGEGATLTLDNPSFSHWWVGIEVALT